MNKITCICLGVKDMERSIKFYRDGLGYKTDCRENNPSVCFFDTPGTKFELFPLEQLAKDIDENNPPKGNGFSGITLAYNVEHNDIILLDELTSGLDYKHMMDISEILKELQSMGKTIIVATHDGEFIESCCSRKLII